jgi:hypothetical protein
MIIRTPDFIPLVLEKGLEQTLQDEMVTIPDGAAVAMAQTLAKNEGILTVRECRFSIRPLEHASPHF